MPFVKKSFAAIYTQMEGDARRRVPGLTDYQEGSVVRSLLESFSAEMALLYEQLDLVYQSGFVDTASGPDLDRVVAALGIKRNEPDFATGVVTFSRDPGANVELTIPISTLVTTEEKENADPPKKAYLTTEARHMTADQNAIDVRIQAEVAGRQMTADAGLVIVMPRPVPGIKAVVNSSPVRFLGRDRETDEDLRQRAKQALLASGRASTTSIENALLGMSGVRDVHVKENFPAEEQTATPDQHFGEIEVYVDGLTAENSAAIRQRIDEVRASGVFAVLKPAVAINLEAVIQIDVNAKITADERAKLEESVRDAVINQVDRLGMGKPLLFSQLTSGILKVNGVNDITKFEMSTFKEVDTYALGTISLHRPMSNAAFTVPLNTTIQTGPGQRFRLTAEAKFVENTDKVDVTVEAFVAGRAGELLRTGSASNWNTLKVGDTSITVENANPIRLPRKSYQLADRLIPVQVLERLSPDSIRVASEMKPLKVRVQIKLHDPNGRDTKRAPLEAAVTKFFQDIASKPERFFTKTELADRLNQVTPAPGSFDLRMVAFAFQGATPQDEFRTDWSFVEKPQPEIIFVYTDTPKLTGAMRLVLSLTAGPDEKRVAVGLARQAISDYLDSVGPEKDIALDQIQQIASGIRAVLRVEFKPEDCGLLDNAGNPIADRVQGTGVAVKAFEKVFLSDDKFVVQA